MVVERRAFSCFSEFSDLSFSETSDRGRLPEKPFQRISFVRASRALRALSIICFSNFDGFKWFLILFTYRFILKPSVPVGAKSAYFCIWADCARLSDHRMLRIVSKRRTAVFYHKLKLENLSNHTYSHNWMKPKIRISQISRFFDFEHGLRETEISF